METALDLGIDGIAVAEELLEVLTDRLDRDLAQILHLKSFEDATPLTPTVHMFAVWRKFVRLSRSN